MLIDLKKGHQDIEGFNFCKKIMLRYDTSARPHKNFVCIKDGYAYSTDGARLHYFKLKDCYANGLYLITSAKRNFVQLCKSKYGNDLYPKVTEIIDKPNYIRLKRSESDAWFRLDSPYHTHACFALARYGIAVNPDFLKDLCGEFQIFVTPDGTKFEHEPVLFKNDFKMAALMPCRDFS